ncbi:hypothetical protein NBRC103581_00354 [Gluconobacter wancherniae NBRC 103581]|nr:hypothetical protein NBRC103581_00354 [Gluconobacter wancherniae NBRC 103581]
MYRDTLMVGVEKMYLYFDATLFFNFCVTVRARFSQS